MLVGVEYSFLLMCKMDGNADQVADASKILLQI